MHSQYYVLCYFTEAGLCPLKEQSAVVKQTNKKNPISQVPFHPCSIQKGKLHFFFVFPLCNLSHSTYPHIRACNTRCKCYLHSLKRVDLPLDYVSMNEQRPQKLACLHFPAMSPLSITSAYLASLTPLDRRTLNKAVAAVYLAVNIISSQSGWTAYIGGKE